MPDNLKNRGTPDRNRINVREQWELNYWCQKLGVTPGRLMQLEKKVGPMVKDIKKELGK
jgi:hypothetical protein